MPRYTEASLYAKCLCKMQGYIIMIYLRRNNILVAVILKTKENCVRCRAFVIGLDFGVGAHTYLSLAGVLSIRRTCIYAYGWFVLLR